MSQFAGDYLGKRKPRGSTTEEDANFVISDLSAGKVRVVFESADLGSTDDGRIMGKNISFSITVGTKKTSYSGTLSNDCTAFPGKVRCIDGMFVETRTARSSKKSKTTPPDAADDGGWTGGQPRN